MEFLKGVSTRGFTPLARTTKRSEVVTMIDTKWLYIGGSGSPYTEDNTQASHLSIISALNRKEKPLFIVAFYIEIILKSDMKIIKKLLYAV